MSEPARAPLSAALPLSRTAVDRDYLTRSRAGVLDELLADSATRLIVLSKGRALLADDPDIGAGSASAEKAPPRLDLIGAADFRAASQLSMYMGRILEGEHSGSALVAVVVDDEGRDAVSDDDARWGDLREIGARLDALDAGIFTEALALANWHESHGFSPRTGEPTVPGSAGWVRYPAGQVDEESGFHVFPRTDPAVIVGVVDHDDRLLLGANARWAGRFYSVLAGFVEPGESFEAAVIREIFEESGILVADPVYLGSQPWPFPASIMVGFIARVAPGTGVQPTPDGDEIIDLRWVTRDEMADGVRTFGIPGRTSIARAIIEHWYGGPLEDA